MGFWEFFWLMVWGFFFIMYLMVLFQIVVDIFRDSKMNGWFKAIWVLALLVVPVITALIYIIARGKGMNQRQAEAAAGAQQATEDYIRSVATANDPASQIASAKSLLDSGAISQAEFDQLKAKALA